MCCHIRRFRSDVGKCTFGLGSERIGTLCVKYTYPWWPIQPSPLFYMCGSKMAHYEIPMHHNVSYNAPASFTSAPLKDMCSVLGSIKKKINCMSTRQTKSRAWWATEDWNYKTFWLLTLNKMSHNAFARGTHKHICTPYLSALRSFLCICKSFVSLWLPQLQVTRGCKETAERPRRKWVIKIHVLSHPIGSLLQRLPLSSCFCLENFVVGISRISPQRIIKELPSQVRGRGKYTLKLHRSISRQRWLSISAHWSRSLSLSLALTECLTHSRRIKEPLGGT